MAQLSITHRSLLEILKTDSAEDRLTNHDQLSQSLDSLQTDSNDDSLGISLPELPIAMEPVQLMNHLSTRLTTKPSTEVHATPFAGTAAENVLNWLKSFNWTATDSVWNDQKQLQVIPVYLKDTALNFELWTKLKLMLTF